MSHKLVSLYIGDGEYYTRADTDNVLAEKDAQIVSLNREIARIQDKMCEDVFEGIMPSEHIVCRPLQQAAEYIAELKAQKAQEEDDCAFWKTQSRKNAADNVVMAEQQTEALKRERHHKFKRCLGLKERCLMELDCAFRDPCIERSAAGCVRWRKWANRWHDLAQFFKEAESTTHALKGVSLYGSRCFQGETDVRLGG